MARLTFPEDRTAFRVPGRGGLSIRSARDALITVYLDEAASQPALDLQTIDGVPVTTGQLHVDAYSQLPLFKGPADGRDTLYVVIDGGPVTAIYARIDDRIDALSTAVAALTSTTPPDLSVETAARLAADAAEASRAIAAENAAATATSAEVARALAAELAEASTRAAADADAAAGTAAEASTRAAADAAEATARAAVATALATETAARTTADNAETAARSALAATEAADAAAAATANGNEIAARAAAVLAEQNRATAAETALSNAIAANTTAIALRAPLASPAFTGTPTRAGAPLLTAGDVIPVYTIATQPPATGSGVVVFVADDGPGTAYKDTAPGVWTPLNPRELNYQENITGVQQIYSTNGSNDITGLVIGVPVCRQSVWVEAECRIGVTVAPAAGTSSALAVNILDDLGAVVGASNLTIEGGSGVTGLLTLRARARIGPVAAARVYKAQVNRSGAAITYGVFNGALSLSNSTVTPAFRSYITAEVK